MNSLVRSLAEAAVLYDEVNGKKNFDALSGATSEFYRRFTDLMAVVMVGTQLRIGIRGTDGKGLVQQLAVWFSNMFDKKPDEIGRHPGFFEAAEWCLARLVFDYRIDELKFDSVNISCHSRGTGIGVNLAPILASFLNDRAVDAPINVDAFAPVPGFNRKGVLNVWNKAHELYGITARLVRNPRDAVAYGLRGLQDDKGADVEAGVTMLDLPPDNWFQRLAKRIGGAHEHRPREYADGMKVYFKGSKETVADLVTVRKMMVN